MYKNLFLVIALLTLTLLTACSPTSSNAPIPPDQLLLQYFAYIESGQFEDMYMMLTERSQASISKEDFIERNRNIYVGIGVQNIIITIIQMYENDPDTGQKIVEYNLHMDTVAGEISHENRNAIFDLNEDNEYRMHWSSRMIFPELGENYRVRVNTLQAARGRIIDRNGITLAGPGYASAVGFVPGRMQTEAAADLEADIAKVAELLEMTVEAVDRRLNASYVRDDTFVLLRTIARDDQDLIDELLTVQGIMISNTPVRYYPLGRKGAHLTGYVQNINAEELEERIREGYHMNSIIGRAGLESILEHPLRARDGIEIFIVDSEGNRSTTLAEKSAFDGRDIRLTIDFHIQSQLYDLFAEDKSASVAMNPITGEILALVSTPSYDPNDFVRGMTMNTWTALNEDENLPLFNRFRATFSPGSTMKAITAAIGINTGSFRPDEDFGPSGRHWQRNESWGGFFVTTVREYSGPANLNNAMAFSDNIYFAKAALRIGAETFTDELSRFGFGERIPFEYGLFSSTISTSGTITSEIQLADSGYGQGQILMNPVHMAAIYAAFVNEGNILQPRLFYDGMVYDNFAERAAPVFWIEDAFSPETARVVLDSLIHSIEVGTGQAARLPGITLAGKTGTAEIKLAQDDTTGTELGWFVLLTVDEAENPLLVVSMVEDVHGRGGSGYVVPRVASLFR